MSSVAEKLQKKAKRPTGTRQVRLRLVYLDFWSMVKLSFLIALAGSIVIIVATALVWIILNQTGVLSLSGQGSSFLGGGVGFALAILVAVIVSSRTAPKPEQELVGLVRGLTDGSDVLPADPQWYRNPKVLAVAVGAITLGGYALLIAI